MNGQWLCVLLMQFAGLQSISALRCYNCTSTKDSRCGSTFGYSVGSKDAKAIIVDCPGSFSACRKIVHSDTHKAEMYTERSCWTYNNNGTVQDKFYTCHEHSFGDVCYCKNKNDDNPCNGQGRVMPIVVIILGLLPFALLR